MTIENLEPEFTDLAWEDEVYDEEEYPFVTEEFDAWDHPYTDIGTIDTWLGDDDLPGMWEQADLS